MKLYDQARSGASLRARELRRNSTDAEKRLWKALRESFPRHKWRRQMPVGPYFADFACFSELLVIELDGGQHDSASEYDYGRTRFIQAQGFRVLRFWNPDVMANLEGVLGAIAAELSTSPSRGSAAHPSPMGEGGRRGAPEG